MLLEYWRFHKSNIKFKYFILFEYMTYHFIGHVSQWQGILMLGYQNFQWNIC